ncbi:uncharacterized protein LOC144563240 [Carex rostrata]
MSNDEIQPLEEISTSKEMDEWVAEIGARHIPPGFSHATRPSMDSNLEELPSIFGNWQCWDDFGVSFLPETEKWQIFACMTHWYDINVRSYLEYLQKKEALAWSYYHRVNKQFRAENSKRFIEHLMVNSCFLIFVMLFRSGEESRKVIMDKVNDKNSHPIGLIVIDINSLLKFVREDSLQILKYLFTMNYQIPWVFVEAVYTEFSNLSKLCVIPIHKLARLFMKDTYPIDHPSKLDGSTVPEGGFKHLVHIFHWSRQPDEKYVADPTRWFNSFHIPSATKLQLSQTVFERDMDTSIDVSYSDNKRVSAVMQLTPLFVSPLKRVLYESLLRFETLYTDCEIPFMVHFKCMACLLKTEADVQVLLDSGVIDSPTSFDKDVLLFVQELKTFISRNHRLPNKLVTLEKNVMAHHKKSVYRVYGEFKKRYCSNPWIIISVIAGIILFILTFIQTVLSFIQTKYSVLSYKQQ